MASTTSQSKRVMDRILSIEIVRVTERAAVSAARLRGRGNEKDADQAAVDAMRRELGQLSIEGTVVIGEGERDEAPMLFIGESVGIGIGPKVDIAVDPLEGTTLCAKDMPGAIATMAMAESGTLLNAPDVYMEKIAIGPGYPKDLIDLDAPPGENIARLAKAKGVKPFGNHRARSGPAASRRLDRGAAQGGRRGIADQRRRRRRRDPYRRAGSPASTSTWASAAPRKACWRRRRSPASAGRCSAGWCSTPRRSATRAAKMGIKDPRKKYGIKDMVKGDCVFAATGVTDGNMLRGVKFRKDVIETETVVMRSVTGTVRWVRAQHRQIAKFHLD